MRVLLMRPNSKVFNLCIPLGLLYLASTLRRQNEVQVMDARLDRTPEQGLRRVLREFRPDLVGISLLTVEAGAGHRDAAIVKEELPDCRVVVGGPYSSSEPIAAVRDKNVDVSVRGEGEETLAELAESFSGGARLAHVKGIAYRQDGRPVVNPERPPVQDLDRLPLPAYDLVQVERYFQGTSGYTQNMMQVKPRAMPIFSSRGCPYSCVYC
ncbi:MAG: cobalamin-dependent protein, partial [Candidatus Eisenbacteria bacterium]